MRDDLDRCAVHLYLICSKESTCLKSAKEVECEACTRQASGFRDSESMVVEVFKKMQGGFCMRKPPSFNFDDCTEAR